MTTTTILNLQRFSLHDGPGIRTTVFMKGCPLSCAWCHNPESMDPRPEVMIKDDRCIGCDQCAPVCGPGIAGRLDMDPQVNRPDETCERCGACADTCPAEARQRAGRTMCVEEVVAEVGRDRAYYVESGGGVTFSGGEPLTTVNAGFTLQALKECRRAGLHTAVDTCGHVSREALLEAGARADIILYDLKIMDSDRHRAATGAGNERILQNLQTLSRAGADIRVRVPLIPGLTDDAHNLEMIARFVKALPGRHPIHVLPYHGTARDKYGRLGKTYGLDDVTAPDETAVAVAVGRVRAFGSDVFVGG